MHTFANSLFIFFASPGAGVNEENQLNHMFGIYIPYVFNIFRIHSIKAFIK